MTRAKKRTPTCKHVDVDTVDERGPAGPGNWEPDFVRVHRCHHCRVEMESVDRDGELAFVVKSRDSQIPAMTAAPDPQIQSDHLGVTVDLDRDDGTSTQTAVIADVSPSEGNGSSVPQEDRMPQPAPQPRPDEIVRRPMRDTKRETRIAVCVFGDGRSILSFNNNGMDMATHLEMGDLRVLRDVVTEAIGDDDISSENAATGDLLAACASMVRNHDAYAGLRASHRQDPRHVDFGTPDLDPYPVRLARLALAKARGET